MTRGIGPPPLNLFPDFPLPLFVFFLIPYLFKVDGESKRFSSSKNLSSLPLQYQYVLINLYSMTKPAFYTTPIFKNGTFL